MPELLRLYLTFFKLGIFNFGGGYAMLPLLERELVDNKGYVTKQDLVDYYAIGQCTPGAIAVNVSTFIGHKRRGPIGGIVATLGFVSPAFFIIFIIASLLTNFATNEFVMSALGGIRVAVFVLVLSAVCKLAKTSIADIWTLLLAITIIPLGIFVKVIPLYAYVIFAGVYGLVVSIIKEKRSAKYTPKEEFISDEPEAEDKVEEPAEVKEEAVVEKHKPNVKNGLIYALGLIIGLITGFIGMISFLFVKNKKYRSGILTSLFFWTIIFIMAMISVFNGGSPTIFYLYFQFFKIGFLAFGGGLATIPFLKELGATTGWFTDVDLANMIAVSESTPGAMGVNMSTYVGYTVALKEYGGNYFIAFLGSIISTAGLISPSIIVILVISLFLAKFKDNKYVKYTFYGLRAASFALIVVALYSILQLSIFNIYHIMGNAQTDGIIYSIQNASYYAEHYYGRSDFFTNIASFFTLLIDYKALALALVLGILVFKFKKHPIIYIVLAAVVGIILRM